jgi:hypothetical protein
MNQLTNVPIERNYLDALDALVAELRIKKAAESWHVYVHSDHFFRICFCYATLGVASAEWRFGREKSI